MAKFTKNQKAALEKIDESKLYAPLEAFKLVQDVAFAKFDETIEAHFRLGLDTRKADQQLRGTVSLPNGSGKTVRVAVFAEGEAARAAEEAGADIVGTDELVAHQNKKVAFKDMTVSAIEYKNGTAGDDIYVTLVNGENTVSACVEVYLTGTETEVYQTVGTLAAGDIVDVEAFLYWYNGANPHITSIVKK
jgi:hypothetical protein